MYAKSQSTQFNFIQKKSFNTYVVLYYNINSFIFYIGTGGII